MAQFHDDPVQLTKEKLKSELLANNVPLPSADSKKDVYVQLYLKNLTVLNKKSISTPVTDTFSSDEELSLPVVSNRSRSGKKATKKTDKVRAEENDISGLTDEELKIQLQKFGVHSGPIVASTRKVYEKKLQQFLDQPPVESILPEPETAVPEAVTITADGNQNGSTHSAEDQYSDKEEETPEPVPVVTKPTRSRGKTPVTTRTSSRQRAKAPVDGADVLKEIFPNEPDTPTGITVTCRRPIHGAAGRPVKPLNLWSEESLLHQSVQTVSKSSETNLHTPPPSTPPKPGRRWFRSLLKLLLLIALAASVYYASQNVTADQINSCRVYVQDNVITPIAEYISWEKPAEGK
ncbi:hypothetical protein DNTS_002162 [Danionella cerebrum]|uniref:LEM domain-containing protein n=1 Tax=Danionella cerebrum TaxID=2873325 RepID=A0A553R1E9_9TELE|nr:hypothetical protein DNTS_002162 [Danionella translucida]